MLTCCLILVRTVFTLFSSSPYPSLSSSSSPSLSLSFKQVRVETKTKDNVFTTLVVSVQYQVIREKLYDAFYRLTDSPSQITAYVRRRKGQEERTEANIKLDREIERGRDRETESYHPPPLCSTPSLSFSLIRTHRPSSIIPSTQVFDVVRATVPKITLDELFIQKEQIAQDVKEELAKSMSEVRIYMDL